MNQKQFIILLVLVVVLGGAGLIIHQRSRQSWQSSDAAIGQKLLPSLSVNDVTQIHIQSGTNNLNLARHNDLWRVAERSDYPADFSKISELLLKLAGLKVAQVEQIGTSQLGRFQLLPPSPATNTATLLELKDQSGKTLDSLLLGKMHMKKLPANSQPQFSGLGEEGWPDGRYVKVGSEGQNVSVISDPLESIQSQPEKWLNKDFLRIENPRSISVQFPETTNSWKLTRASETNEWQLADTKTNEILNTANLSAVTSPLGSASFNDVATMASNRVTYTTVLNVETFDGFNYIAKVGPKQDANYPVSVSISAHFASERVASKDEKPEDKAKLDKEFKDQQSKLTEKLNRESQFTNWVYTIPSYTMDPFLKTREQLLVEPKKEEEPKSGNGSPGSN